MGPNETILRRAYDRYSGGDTQYLYEILSNDVVWKSSGNPQVLAFAGEQSGKDGVREYFAKMSGEWNLQKHVPVEFIAQDDRRFAVRVAIEAVNKRTGGQVKLEKIDLVTMADGKCTAYAELFDTALVERAAGHGPNETAK